jgi:hypothetical protein
MSDEGNALAVEPVDLNAPPVEPKPETAPPPQEGDAPIEPAVEVADEAEDKEAEEKRKLNGSERQKRKAQRLAGELAEAQRVNEELLRRIQGSNETQKSGKPGVDREPNENDFPGDYFAFERAKTSWDVRTAIRQERETEMQSRRQAQHVESRMEMVDDYAEAVDKVRQRIPDFDKVVQSVNIKVPNELADEILSAGDKAPLISYFLAQNPDKLMQLAGMTGKELAREVGRIEARVHMPKAKTATEASPPPNIPKGGAAPAFNPFKSDDMDAYVKWRAAGGGKKAS